MTWLVVCLLYSLFSLLIDHKNTVLSFFYSLLLSGCLSEGTSLANWNNLSFSRL